MCMGWIEEKYARRSTIWAVCVSEESEEWPECALGKD
jgi:hypothetical protein